MTLEPVGNTIWGLLEMISIPKTFQGVEPASLQPCDWLILQWIPRVFFAWLVHLGRTWMLGHMAMGTSLKKGRINCSHLFCLFVVFLDDTPVGMVNMSFVMWDYIHLHMIYWYIIHISWYYQMVPSLKLTYPSENRAGPNFENFIFQPSIFRAMLVGRVGQW